MRGGTMVAPTHVLVDGADFDATARQRFRRTVSRGVFVGGGVTTDFLCAAGASTTAECASLLAISDLFH